MMRVGGRRLIAESVLSMDVVIAVTGIGRKLHGRDRATRKGTDGDRYVREAAYTAMRGILQDDPRERFRLGRDPDHKNAPAA